MTRTVLLTGATGFLGGELIRRLLTWDGGIRLVVLLRAPSEAHAQFRGVRLLEELARDPAEAARWSPRVRFLRSELTAPDLGLSTDQRAGLAESVTEIVHAAASVRFDQPLEEARAINLGGPGASCRWPGSCSQGGGSAASIM
jgi:thioester reductase-like protein